MNAVTAPPQAESITLYHRERSSDKVYHISIEPRGGLFVVNFAYGQRGTTLQTGTEVSEPVAYDTAKRIYGKLVQEKLAKGYTPEPESTPYQHTDKEEQASGILPQLLNPVAESELNRLIADPGWCAQEEYDGRRVLLRKRGAAIDGINREGLTIALPQSVLRSARDIPGDFVMDGECVGNTTLYAFDLIEDSGASLRSHSYQQRFVALRNLLALAMLRNIRLAATAFPPVQKRHLLNWLRREKREGIVFKRLDAPYTPGRPASGGPALTHKFCATLCAVVAKVSPQHCVELRLLNYEGWIPIGQVTIPANQPMPKIGEVVEVRYLYAFRESNALCQPVYLGQRQDIEPHECLHSQLKFKTTEPERE